MPDSFDTGAYVFCSFFWSARLSASGILGFLIYFSNTAAINPQSARAGNPERRDGQTGEGAVVGEGLEAVNFYEIRQDVACQK